MHGETKPESPPKSNNSSTGPAMVDHGRHTITEADHGYITPWFESTFGMEKKEALWYTNQATENFKLHSLEEIKSQFYPTGKQKKNMDPGNK